LTTDRIDVDEEPADEDFFVEVEVDVE